MSEMDFEGALEYLQSKHYYPQDMMKAFYGEVEAALRLAKRMQSGEVSDGMYSACPNFLHTYAGFHLTEVAFKAMSQQLMKEVSDE